MTYSLNWLANVLKDAGLKVVPCDGWENRGVGDVKNIMGVMCHHTGNFDRSSNMPTLSVLINGRMYANPLHGPLAQLGLGRDGTFYVVAAGKANHAGLGSWQGITSGNEHFIGIEAENTGEENDFPWPAAQLEAFHRGVAAILEHIGKCTNNCIGHKEWAPFRKSDPNFDMNSFRSDVDRYLRDKTQNLPKDFDEHK